MRVYLFRIKVICGDEEKEDEMEETDSNAVTVHLPDSSVIRGCDEIPPVWFDNWHDVPLNNMFADDTIWLTTLLTLDTILLDGWFHFKAGGQEIKKILPCHLAVRPQTIDNGKK
jgi:hypothetical protein